MSAAPRKGNFPNRQTDGRHSGGFCNASRASQTDGLDLARNVLIGTERGDSRSAPWGF
jgi:hypothetical protein